MVKETGEGVYGKPKWLRKESLKEGFEEGEKEAINGGKCSESRAKQV